MEIRSKRMGRDHVRYDVLEIFFVYYIEGQMYGVD